VINPGLPAEARDERKSKPTRARKGPSDAMISFGGTAAGVALASVGDFVPSTTHFADWAGRALGLAVATIPLIRERRKNKNADRPEG